MKKLIILFAYFYAMHVFAGLPIPKDQNNTPIYSSQGTAYLVPTFTLTTGSYVDVYTLPTDTFNINRIWKHLAVYNPSTTRTLYVCFGTSSSCSTDMMQIPPSIGLILDDLMYGYPNNITDIWMRLDSTGSVSPQATAW